MARKKTRVAADGSVAVSALDALISLYDSVVSAEEAARNARKLDEADLLNQWGKALHSTIGYVRKKALQNWTAQAAALTASIGEANAAIKKEIRNLEDVMKAAEATLKILGYLADVIKVMVLVF